jgi:5-methylcytosine-specific restriction endonuclease McrA
MAAPWSGGYTKAPRALRNAVLRDTPWCAYPGCTNPAAEVDHVIPVAECYRAGVNPHTRSNLQGLCSPHHAAKTEQDKAAGRQQAAARRLRRPNTVHPAFAERRPQPPS